MKKFTSILILMLVLILSNNSNAFYLWQDFENPTMPPLGWTLNTTNDFNWDWSILCSGYGNGYGSCKGNASDANVGMTFDLITPVFPLASAGDSLKFDHAYATYGGANDQLQIWYSTNGGTSWTSLVLLNGGTSGELVTAPATGLAFVPTSSQWATKKYALPLGTNKLKFTCIAAYGNNMYIDNIKIGTPYTNDAGATGFYRFNKAITPGTIDTPKVYVRNFGTTATTFPVTVTLTPGSYTSTQTVTNLAPGAVQLVTFTPWTATTLGNCVFKAYSNLSTDQNHINDTIYNNYVVTNNPRNALIEYCTGTWCQWCPCAKVRIMDLQNFYSNTNVLAYHGGSTSDPYYNFNGNNILTLFGMNAYPTGTVERLIGPANCGYSGFFEYTFMRYLNSPVSPVKIEIASRNYNSGTKQLDMTINSTALTDLTGQYKINFVISEKNLVFNQTGNGYCTGGTTYVHHWVVRNMVNTAAGENLNTGGTWTNGQIIPKSFSTTLNSTWIDNNCEVTIFVYKDASPLYKAETQQSLLTPVVLTGINDPKITPVKFELMQNYPNPFNPLTNIKFSIPKDAQTSLKIYDITGKLVYTYLNEYLKAGQYNADFDASSLSSGVYFYTLKSGDFKETKKMLLVK